MYIEGSILDGVWMKENSAVVKDAKIGSNEEIEWEQCNKGMQKIGEIEKMDDIWMS